MQTEETRYLYTFTSNFLKGQGTFDTAFGQLQTIGLVIYAFQGWSGEKEFVGESLFCPITDLQFDSYGTPIPPEEGISEKIIGRMMELAGIDTTDDRSIEETNQVMGEVTRSQALQSKLQSYLIQAAFEQLGLDEQQELAAYFQTKPEVEPVFQGRLKFKDLPELLNQPELMDLAGVETRQVLLILEQLPIPEAFKKMLRWMLNAQKLISNAAFLKWQEESEVLRESR